jgi:hypothetical protein
MLTVIMLSVIMKSIINLCFFTKYHTLIASVCGGNNVLLEN